MATQQRLEFSSSIDGKQILITTTATAGDLIHTVSSTTTDFDEIWLFAENSDSVSRLITVEFGGVIDPNDTYKKTLPPVGAATGDGLINIVPGISLKGNAVPLLVRAFAATANVVKVSGYINRRSEA